MGVMAGMGRLPKSGARQPNRGLGAAPHVLLPAAGRRGRPPAWPLEEQTPRERVLWRALWRAPQAVAWEQLGWPDVVARYARVVAEAERPGAGPSVRAEARQLEDRLGLSPVAMLRLRWAIGTPEPQVAVLDDIRTRLRSPS
jgi:hypothetical protein